MELVVELIRLPADLGRGGAEGAGGKRGCVVHDFADPSIAQHNDLQILRTEPLKTCVYDT